MIRVQRPLVAAGVSGIIGFLFASAFYARMGWEHSDIFGGRGFHFRVEFFVNLVRVLLPHLLLRCAGVGCLVGVVAGLLRAILDRRTQCRESALKQENGAGHLTTTPARWHQFSLRSLLVAVTLASVIMSCFAAWWHAGARTREAERTLDKVNGEISFGHGFRFSPNTSDDDLARIVYFPGIKELDLYGTEITDAGLPHMRRLTDLRVLSLACTKITDEGLTEVGEFVNLERLNLMGTSVSVAGLKSLRRLDHLATLELIGMNIEDDDLSQLPDLPELRELDLRLTNVTRAGLRQLARFPKLKVVRLGDDITAKNDVPVER
jgi:hypothetical protein